jgi:sarcosine oxidase, subunit beta
MIPTADIVIIGGGCMGTSIALQLARRGAGKIVLLEKHEIASGASGRSSAIVRMHYAHEALARMALRARTIYEQFEDAIGGECGFRRTGFIAMAGVADVETLKINVAMHQRIGIDARVLMPDDLAELEPRLMHAGVGAAAWEPDSGHADGHTTTASYAAAARRQGVEILTGVSVRRILTDARGIVAVETSGGSISARTLVVAAGYRTRELLAPLGVDIPITPVRHAIAIVQRSAGFGPMHPTISDRVLGSYYRPEGAELTLIGTTAPYEGHVDEEVEADRTVPPDELRTLSGRFLQRFPAEGAAALRGGYTGVYDCSPDLQPLLGPVPSQLGLHVAVGFSGHGFKLSPVIGELMSEKIMTGRTTLVDLDIFSPNRFIENRPITVQRSYSVQTLS